MAMEIERKFLPLGDAWRGLATAVLCRQGYLNSAKECTVRVRTMGGKAFLTVKGLASGASRAEFEYEIPYADGEAMLETLVQGPLIEKNRHFIPHGGLIWEVDEFLGANAGLVIIEVELARANQIFDAPPWVGEEVTDDPRYYNANLAKYPFSLWK